MTTTGIIRRLPILTLSFVTVFTLVYAGQLLAAGSFDATAAFGTAQTIRAAVGDSAIPVAWLLHSSHTHFLFNIAGVLHDESRGMQPEKSLRDIDPKHLHRQFAVNSIGPLLVAKHFHPFFGHGERAVFANMSARVGSIGDNRKGGWYGYRASKAAQNQFTRTLSIELGRRAPETICVALHPGTVDTDLSAPFHTHIPDDQVVSVDEAVDNLLGVIDGLTADDSGEFFDWAGEPIEW
jgi:NAD(P)-dependent dehydrogenase (short-subunit alcohol dehydrogenase family)